MNYDGAGTFSLSFKVSGFADPPLGTLREVLDCIDVKVMHTFHYSLFRDVSLVLLIGNFDLINCRHTYVATRRVRGPRSTENVRTFLNAATLPSVALERRSTKFMTANLLAFSLRGVAQTYRCCIHSDIS